MGECSTGTVRDKNGIITPLVPVIRIRPFGIYILQARVEQPRYRYRHETDPKVPLQELCLNFVENDG